MAETMRYESIQEPLDEEERELMDPEQWDWETAEFVAGGIAVAFEVSPQFSSQEYETLAALAERLGTDPTEAARRIILNRLAEKQPRRVAGVGRGQAG